MMLTWLRKNVQIFKLDFRLSYLPPLMIYVAAGIQGVTAIVGSFYVKEYTNLNAEFLTGLMFWATLPWILKMPLGHLVDLMWRYKSYLVLLGASLIACSLAIMIAIMSQPEHMQSIMPISTWYTLSFLLAPIGYVLQDVVADAMTVESVPSTDSQGKPIPEQQLKLMHTTMQTLGRVAIIGGVTLVAALNYFKFEGVSQMSKAEKLLVYIDIYQIAFIIPIISVSGIVLAYIIKLKNYRNLLQQGVKPEQANSQVNRQLNNQEQGTQINWPILVGSLIFVSFTVMMGLLDVSYSQEIIFLGSLLILVFIIARLLPELSPQTKKVFIATALIIFAFRTMPTQGVGAEWWMIDVLKFDQQFFAVLSLIAGLFTLLTILVFRKLIATKSISAIILTLTLFTTVLALPIIGMFYGLHDWTSQVTGGIVDAKFIIVINLALDSPLGQIALIPMLALIANSAPQHLKATFFAVMTSFMNLALSMSQLITKYGYEIFTVSREVKKDNIVTVAADYSELGSFLILVTLIGLAIPLITILIVKLLRVKSA